MPSTTQLYRNDSKSPADMARTLNKIFHPTRILRKQVLSVPDGTKYGRRMARTIPVSGDDAADKETRDRFVALARWQGCTDHGHQDLRMPYED